MAPSHAAADCRSGRPGYGPQAVPPSNAYVALGLAVSHLMTKPAFAKLRFGDWSRILTGQINRKHYCFAIDGNNQVQGFLGWALTSKDKAEAWVEGRGAVSFGDSQDGDCVILNAWAASTPEANRFLLAQARRIIDGKDTVYFKRHYKDGDACACASTTSSRGISGGRSARRREAERARSVDRPAVTAERLILILIRERTRRCLSSREPTAATASSARAQATRSRTGRE